MDKIDLKLEILDQVRRSLTHNSQLSSSESEEVLKLVNALIEAAKQDSDPAGPEGEARSLTTDSLRNRTLLVSLKQQADELDALKQLGWNLTSSLDLQTVLEAVVTEAMRLVKNTHAVNIYLYTSGKLEFGASLNREGIRNAPVSMPRPEGLTNRVARSGQEMIVENVLNHPLYANTARDWSGSIIGIPLKVDDRVVGVMNLSRSIPGPFPSTELRLLGLLADQAAVAISNASLHQLVSKQAYSDTVTGLPNRRALDERLEQELVHARRAGTPFAVVMMDLDDFKTVNDTFGHAVGDQVLRSVFNYLATGLRSSDFLARYGGDELTLILSKTDLASARVVVEKIVEKMVTFHFDVPNGSKFHIGLSSGIAIYPIHALTSANLLRAADEALYRAKKHNRGSFALARGFTGALNQEVF